MSPKLEMKTVELPSCLIINRKKASIRPGEGKDKDLSSPLFTLIRALKITATYYFLLLGMGLRLQPEQDTGPVCTPGITCWLFFGS